MAHQLSLKISGMHCEACVRRVRAALGKLPGITVEDVQVGSARVRTETTDTDQDVIRTAIARTGFAVESLEDVS